MGRGDGFLRRWSRRKRDAAAGVDIGSDFKAFMRSKVEEGVKRAALRKLFSDPSFNVMDGLDVYIDDYTKGETLTPEMVAALEHAKRALACEHDGEAPAEEPPQSPSSGERGEA